ncbi:peptide deformylase [Tersicoccus sp. Bi-70]|uniref:peptide deformylase n=1 Tax=Tersicoccus sp. Bi-70 TaxID=1897634 RepID=UPI0009773E8F|nr:peptide deformylase [Tersicoccus sp. Bi-70]OMH33133.1 peptide deformylase [Tersicoccus sp. Bi-70]
MAILPVRVLGDPILRTRAEAVTRFDDALARLVEDMHETMIAVGGVGLAGPQVGVGLRVFTWEVDGSSGHVVNPVLTIEEETQAGMEGCLSVPAIGGHTTRAQRATVTGVDVGGAPVTVTGEGLLARCLQHETDHLDGMLYLDRLIGDERRTVMAALRTDDWRSAVDQVQAERRDLDAAGSVTTPHRGTTGAAPTSAPGRAAAPGASFFGGGR